MEKSLKGKGKDGGEGREEDDWIDTTDYERSNVTHDEG